MKVYLTIILIFKVIEAEIFICQTYEVTPAISNVCQFVFINDATCSYTQFKSCRYNEKCLLFNGTQCVSYDLLEDRNLTSCQQKCCANLALENQIIYNFLSCDSIDNSTSSKSQQNPPMTQMSLKQILIGGSNVLLAVLTIIFIIKKCQSCANQRPEDSGEDNPQSQRVLHERQTEIIKQWKSEKQSMKDKFVQESCCICLVNAPNCFTSCNHIYHKKCYWQWIKIKNSCPLCKSNNIHDLKIYCTNCYSFYYECKIQQIVSSFKNEDLCTRCQK